MKFLSYQTDRGIGTAAEFEGGYRGLSPGDANFPGVISELLRAGKEDLRQVADTLWRHGHPVDTDALNLLPPVHPGKIICIGLNYADHALEAGLQVPQTPTVFSRFPTSIVGSNAPIVMPKASVQFDFEGELAVVIGKPGRHIAVATALDHVAGYSCFNDGSVRDYQLRTSQWMIGKNFDRSGAFGPALVTPEELPLGASGLLIQTRLNGELVQSSSTKELIFDVATLIALLSEVFELQPGDVIATGTPAGVGLARIPQLWMKAGDVFEVEIEGVGVLRNTVQSE